MKLYIQVISKLKVQCEFNLKLQVRASDISRGRGAANFKSAKSREIHKNTRNPAKFVRNLTKYMLAKCFESYLGCWGCLLAVNLLIYLETSSPQRVNNIPKLPGVLRLMLRKTGKQRCKNPGIPGLTVETGDESVTVLCARS